MNSITGVPVAACQGESSQQLISVSIANRQSLILISEAKPLVLKRLYL